MSTGILTCCASELRFPSLLSPRLTLIRLTLIRNPESFGGRVSHPPYRYLCLHLLFLFLHGGLPPSASLSQECSPTTIYSCISSKASVLDLMPVYYRCPTRSTSELLRTL